MHWCAINNSTILIKGSRGYGFGAAGGIALGTGYQKKASFELENLANSE